MSRNTPIFTALDRAIEAAGSHAALAAGIKVSANAPSMWKSRKNVPAEHCPGIERFTRQVAAEKSDPSLIVTCEELRPDVAWEVLRDQVLPPTLTPDAPAAVASEAV